MSWRDISTSETDANSPITTQLMSALRDNLEAVAQGLADSITNQTGWHFYDEINVGDGTTAIADFDSGSAASVESAAFVDGYEYGFFFDRVSGNNNNWTIDLEFYRESDASYATADAISTSIASSSYSVVGVFIIKEPRLLKYHHSGEWWAPLGVSNNGADVSDAYAGVSDGTRQAISKARISIGGSGTSFDGGKIYQIRRRTFLT